MYDDFFFPYEKAKLWTGNMVLLSLSNFLLYASLYMMLPALPLWMVRHWYCSYAEAGAAVAVFGLAMFLPGAFNSYLIDTFKRKSVCLVAMLLFVASSLLYPYVATVGFIALVRAVQGGLFSVITMTTGSTLVIDVTASRRRTDANIAFSWVGRFGMVAGLALGIYIYPYWNFHHVVYTCVALGTLALLLILAVDVPFRAPLRTSWFSLDRFLLPRTLWPALNMMMLSAVFGILIAHIYNELFYICILIGFIDTFKRKSVCLVAMLLFVASSLLYPYVATVGFIALVRAVQGGLFSVITMTTGSTLVIDVTASRRRTDANIAFSWVGRFGMVAGLALGIYIYPYWNFHHVVYTCVALGTLALLLILAVDVPFRAPLRTSWFSLDRFLLPRTLWPALNMMMLSAVFGILIAHIYNELFYICILIGFIISLLLLRYVLSYASGRSEVELGQAAMIGGLLLLAFSNSLMNSYIAGVLLGTGIGTTVSRFFIKMISLPMHCERGTGNNTYQLMWEVGMLSGFLFENMWTESHPDTIYWICIGICVTLLLMYEFFTHPWYYRKMEEKQ